MISLVAAAALMLGFVKGYLNVRVFVGLLNAISADREAQPALFIKAKPVILRGSVARKSKGDGMFYAYIKRFRHSDRVKIGHGGTPRSGAKNQSDNATGYIGFVAIPCGSKASAVKVEEQWKAFARASYCGVPGFGKKKEIFLCNEWMQDFIDKQKTQPGAVVSGEI